MNVLHRLFAMAAVIALIAILPFSDADRSLLFAPMIVQAETYNNLLATPHRAGGAYSIIIHDTDEKRKTQRRQSSQKGTLYN